MLSFFIPCYLAPKDLINDLKIFCSSTLNKDSNLLRDSLVIVKSLAETRLISLAVFKFDILHFLLSVFKIIYFR